MHVLAISLFVISCATSSGTILCREVQIKSFPTLTQCEYAAKALVEKWHKGASYIDPTMVGYRCGPSEKEDNDI